MKNIICLALLLCLSINTLSSQRTRTRDRNRGDRVEEKENFRDNIWYGISLGNLFFFGDFSFSGKFQAGYKPINAVSIGLQAKFYYDFQNNVGPDLSLFSYGGGPEVRLKITEGFYAIGEYNIMSIEGFRSGSTIRSNMNYPNVGIGYQQGRGPWKFGAQILFILNDEARDPNHLNRAVDYWIDFNYKF